MIIPLTKEKACALGDIRDARPGDVFALYPGVETRKDWPRYIDAIGVAITRGADVRWVR